MEIEVAKKRLLAANVSEEAIEKEIETLESIQVPEFMIPWHLHHVAIAAERDLQVAAERHCYLSQF